MAGGSTLIAGPSGAGKTLMGCTTSSKAPRWAGPASSPASRRTQRSSSVSSTGGWSLDRDDVHVMYRSPVDMYLDEWVYELLAAVEEHGIRRI